MFNKPDLNNLLVYIEWWDEIMMLAQMQYFRCYLGSDVVMSWLDRLNKRSKVRLTAGIQ
jgi:hypothetical protein